MEGENTPGIVGSSKFTWNIPDFHRRRVCIRTISLPVAVNEFQHVFCAESKSWGSPYFTPLSKIKSPAERFLVNDNLTVEAMVVVLGAVHYSTAYKANKVSQPEPYKAPEATVGAPIVPGIPVKVEPLHHSKGGSEQTPVTSDQGHNVPATEGTKIHSKDEAFVQIASKRLLTELSSRRKKHKPIFSSEILGSNQAPDSANDFQQQLKEALRVFFDMPFEAIQQANCFVKIEKCLQELVEHTNDLQERTVFEDIMSRLANFKRSIYNAKEIAEAAETRRSYLARKTADLDSELEQRQKELSSLESDFSMLSGEEAATLRAEIDRVIAQKKPVSVKLERANEETRKEIEEWRSLEAEMKKVNAEWVGAKEKLASANVHWDLLREDLGFWNL